MKREISLITQTNMKLKNIIYLCLILLSGQLFSQQLNYPLAKPFSNDMEQVLYSSEVYFHTAVKPWLIPEINKIINMDSLKNIILIKSNYNSNFCNSAWDKIFNENLIIINKQEFKMTIDPVINFELGKDIRINNDLKFVNTRGVLAEGSIGKDFSFSSTFYENQSTFIDYLDSNIRKVTVVPGQGPIKEFKGSGFDYAWASAYISYTPSKYFNFQFGHGKNFIGDGYRSLLLSDNAFNYPYLKISTNVWRFKYINLYGEFQDLKTLHSYDLGYRKKYGTFHYLSFAASKRVNIGIFESVIWKAEDSTGFRGFDINYLNPVIFFRPVEFSLGSPDNALMGLNISTKIGKSYVAYGQLLIDEFKIHEVMSGNGWWGNKQAFQLGVKAFDLFTVNNLFLQSEFNFVRPYTYSSRSSLQNYGHYNQALAHPLGANFWESVNFIKYNYKRFFIELKYSYALYGADTANIDFGQDIFQSYNNYPKEFSNYTGQGLETILTYKDFRISYLVNPSTNLNISLGISDRTETTSLYDKHSTFVYFGIRTSLHNFYYDF